MGKDRARRPDLNSGFELKELGLGPTQQLWT